MHTCRKRNGTGTDFIIIYLYSYIDFAGEWAQDKRSGWGRMYYEDGSVYEGEWKADQRNGLGMMRFKDENRYEGTWRNDMKHGDGKYFYLDKVNNSL